jgi:carbon storage regulator CsrA
MNNPEVAMLVITRSGNDGDNIIYISDNIRITVNRVSGGKVRLGIDAPRDIKVIRQEIADDWLRQAWGDQDSLRKGGRP